MRRKKPYIIISIIFILLIVAAITHTLWLEAIGRFLIVGDKLSPADVIVVLGGGGLERVRHGVKLYQLGYGAKIIVTGMGEARLTMQEAVSLGVSEDAIILEEKATDTHENAEYVKQIMVDRNFRSAIVVSSPHHMRRARRVFRKVFEDREDISLQFSPVEDSDFRVHKWWTRRRDLKRVITEYRKLLVWLFKHSIV